MPVTRTVTECPRASLHGEGVQTSVMFAEVIVVEAPTDSVRTAHTTRLVSALHGAPGLVRRRMDGRLEGARAGRRVERDLGAEHAREVARADEDEEHHGQDQRDLDQGLAARPTASVEEPAREPGGGMSGPGLHGLVSGWLPVTPRAGHGVRHRFGA